MFRTEIPLTPLPHQLPPSARVLTLGSCFSDTIGSRLTEFKVATMVNPFGTVFNPISACKLLRAAAGEDMDWQQHLVEARGRWQSYDLHAEIGAESPVELLQHVQQLAREVGVFLATADVVVLTLGSAYAYRLRETGELVSNCHKVSADQFDKELLTADEIIAAVAETHAYLRRINPKLRFVLTVSPVRHLKDTLVLNSASKAMLRVACHYLSELLPDVTYFPAYELLVDDLRDYRFYASDMLHLSETAENYVWERFTRTYFDAAFGRFKKEWEGIRLNLGHRPLYAAAPEHRAFLENTLERLRKLSGQADVRMELLHVERELANLPVPTAAVATVEYDDGEERIDVGSFDDDATPDEAPLVKTTPVTAAEAAAVTSAAPTKAAPQEPAQPRSASRASLIRPGAGLLVEEAEDDEPTEDDDAVEAADAEVSADSAYDHAYSPVASELTAGSAEEEIAEDDNDEPEATGPESAEEASRRKKRRSRGGAKRTKRKHARLAAEQAAGEDQSESSVVATAPAPVPDEPLAAAEAQEADNEPATDVIYVTEAELRAPRPRPEASIPAELVAPEADAEPEVAAEPAVEGEAATEEVANRRSRNNRRGNKREQAPRYGGRPARQPLYAADAEAPASEAASPVAEPASAAATTTHSGPAAERTATPEPTAPVSEKPVAEVAVATAATETAAKKRASRSRPAKGSVAPAQTAGSAGAVPSASIATPALAPSVEVASPRKPTRRKADAKAATPAAVPPASAKESQSAPVNEVLATAAVSTDSTSAPVAEPTPAKSATKKRTATKPKPTAKFKASTKPKEVAQPEAAAKPAAAEATPVPTEAKAAAKPKSSVKPKAAVKPKVAAKGKAPTKAQTSAKVKPTEPAATPPADTPAPTAKPKAAAKPRAKSTAKKKEASDTPAPETT
ncbi:hypothetical protein CDA63_03440 [Hymenobacter amundsenii]|uniref:GSCFA domain-containing protein n=1 Tax=Hymenobacter amundsenii TaxID=2006685 RepID=A0A246FNZ4_9BACT|nr:GSCFA domain-containing protein [Hymenobacter amundsenii]OWP64442.1 hypothetical protein CDA63_03440 [Hymenobacter amundsenii]